MACAVLWELDLHRGDNMIITVLAISTTQVSKNNRVITLLADESIELDTTAGDTYSEIACRVINKSKTFNLNVNETIEETIEESSEEDIDVMTAGRAELFAFVEANAIELPAALRKKNVATEKLREGILNALQG